jgi:glycosyltransferase involved in cell wall biosynthesis
VSASGERPRLLYLITSPLSARFLRGQLRHLVDAGFDVVVGVGGEDGEAGAGFDDGVEVVTLPYVRRPRPLADAHALVATIRLIRRVRPALVNASTPKAGLVGTLAAAICRVPVRVYVVRGLRFERMAGRGRMFYRRLERLTMRCANQVIFNSASLRHMAVEEGLLPPASGHVLGAGSGNGVDADRFALLPGREEARKAFGLESGVAVMGYVGRLNHDKGIADLIEVFARLASDNRNLRLLVVGDHGDDDHLDPAVSTAIAGDPRIVHVPWTDSVASAYVAMDVLVFPSYREGLPNAPLEAQLCGVPVVGYAATGTVDAVRSGVTGTLVPVGDRVALRDAVAAMLADADRSRAMGAAGAAWVASAFSPAVVWYDLLGHYRRWLGVT